MCYRVLMCCPSAEEIFLILSLSMHLGLIRGVCGWEAAAFISGLLSVYVCVCVFVLVEEKAKLSVVRRLSFTS